jgi:hypothetical protein
MRRGDGCSFEQYCGCGFEQQHMDYMERMDWKPYVGGYDSLYGILGL